MVEAFCVGDIKSQHAAVRPAIVARSECAESLLPRRVPYLQAHSQVIVQERLRFAINADRWHCLLTGERSIGAYPQEHGCLSTAGVADYNNFELLVESHLGLEDR